MPSWLLAGLLTLTVASVAIGAVDLVALTGRALGWWP